MISSPVIDAEDEVQKGDEPEEDYEARGAPQPVELQLP